ncbi:trigger factor [TM7 phylum sp. oral taxon 350]|nr:trigger factor [TM7 phylum sp. oral taxon 350]
MKTDIKKISEVKVEITFDLDKDDLKNYKQIALYELGKDLKVDGFRKGKVPINVVEKNVKKELLIDTTIDIAIKSAIIDCSMKENLQVISKPEVDIMEFDFEKGMKFIATIELLPEPKLVDFTKIKVKEEKVEVKDSEVNDILKRFASSMAEKKEVKRAAKLSDEVIIDFTGIKDGVEFEGGKAKDYPLVLGSNSFIPGFEGAIVGMKAGESKDIDLTFPKDYHAKDLKGAKVTFKVTVNSVKEVKDAKIDDELAKRAGADFKTLDDLKADIKLNIKQNKERQAKDKFTDEVLKQLVEKSEIELPEVLISEQVDAVTTEVKQNLAYQGLSEEKYLEENKLTREEWIEKEIRPIAVSRAKLGVALSQVAKDLKTEVSDQDVDKEIKKLSLQYQGPEFKERLASPEIRNDLKNRLIINKAVDELVALVLKNK